MTDRLAKIMDHNFEFIDWKLNKIDSTIWQHTVSIRSLEPAVKNVHKIMKKQKRFNRNICALTVASMVCIAVMWQKLIAQEKRIDRLNDEIETLKGE